MNEIIRVENLRKEFDHLIAVNDINFSINEGEIFGFLGPNGAGKTTTLSILSTLLPPTRGKALVNQFDVQKQPAEVRRSIGVVFQDPTLDDELTAFENMDFHGRMYGMKKDKRKEKIDELLELVELDKRKRQLVKTFSGGMKRRLEIARGILHEPKILFLDEPTLGLDPQTKNHLWDYIKNLKENKKITIILTTHYMDEADKLSDTIAIIDQGKIIVMDSPEKLKDNIEGSCIRIRSKDQDKIQESVSNIEWINKISAYDDFIEINVKNVHHNMSAIMKNIFAGNVTVESIDIHTPTLEDVFLHFTGKTIREEEASAKDRIRTRYSRR